MLDIGGVRPSSFSVGMSEVSLFENAPRAGGRFRTQQGGALSHRLGPSTPTPPAAPLLAAEHLPEILAERGHAGEAEKGKTGVEEEIVDYLRLNKATEIKRPNPYFCDTLPSASTLT